MVDRKKKMRRVGLVGGISWISTIDYYRYINEEVNRRLGGLQFADLSLYSINFGDIQEVTWDHAFPLLLHACETLQATDVEGLALCANTAHLYAEQLGEKLGLPLVHIGDATATVILSKGIKTVGLLGTRFTMEKDFYKNRLRSHGLEVIAPHDEAQLSYIQETLRNELSRGIVTPQAKEKYRLIATDLIQKGAEGIILGCTELPLVLAEGEIDAAMFDTTRIHADAIVDFMLS